MKAKEMFEKLGYELDDENEWDLTYSKSIIYHTLSY